MAASTTHYLPFTRFTRQVSTDAMAVLATETAAMHAEDLLKVAPWMEAADTESKSTFPARSATQTGFNVLWDAFKFCGDYASGYQKAYAGMVAYRFKIPAAGLTGPSHITGIALPLYVDRWLVDGVRVAAYLSNSAVPPTDWTTCREGTVHEDAELPMEYTADTPPVRIVVEKDETLTVSFAASTDALAYLYVIVSLEDYTTVRGFWIEGAALIVGDRALTTFDGAIEPDASTVWNGEVWCDGKFQNAAAISDACWQVKRSVAIAAETSIIAAFPLWGNATETQFAGGTGASVGISYSAPDMLISGMILARYVGCGVSTAFTKLRFSDADFAPMSGKTFRLKMCIYAGSVNLDAGAVMSRPKAAATGYINALLWQGAAAVSVLPTWYTGGAAADQTAWSLTKIGDVILGAQDYTDAATFPIALPAGGTRVILITLMPVIGWGTIGANTVTTIQPGANIVLS